MDKLIKITVTENGNQAVSAKELYNYLGYDSSNWKRWSDKNIVEDNFFDENIDYQTLVIMTNGNETKDFAISLDMAKELSMLARTQKGKIARKYFIQCEKSLKQKNKFNLPQTYSEALRLLADTKEREEKALIELSSAKNVIEENKPKVVFADSVIGSSNSILVRDFAKVISDEEFKIGQNRLFEWFRENKYLMKNNKPYQNYVDSGYFEVIERSIGSGTETFTSTTTKITGRGQVYFAKKIKS